MGEHTNRRYTLREIAGGIELCDAESGGWFFRMIDGRRPSDDEDFLAWQQELAERILSSLNSFEGIDEIPDAKVSELVDALRLLTVWCRTATEGSRDCGDPWAECPMQDAGKPYSLAGHLEKAAATLAKWSKP